MINADKSGQGEEDVKTMYVLRTSFVDGRIIPLGGQAKLRRVVFIRPS